MNTITIEEKKNLQDDIVLDEVVITDNYLITYPDGTADLNHYGDFIKLLARAKWFKTGQPVKFLRFSSTSFPAESLTVKHWKEFKEKVYEYLKTVDKETFKEQWIVPGSPIIEIELI